MEGDAISLVIVDNGQIYIGEEDGGGNAEVSAMGEVVRWMNSDENKNSARRKLLVLTSSILVSEELCNFSFRWATFHNWLILQMGCYFEYFYSY